ncbi:LacI family transcriptional regulator [Couchioplanes caeruleus]|uniref:LacI family DNA-binding transcriptional regulator n=1 Tax=Couchioplanes caeruleus TaxID=56438 RepID=UPI0020C064D2|nr:LacI family DNA-binding transcriptional regulator [Couchioplanes caeruleus]UQU66478.1 LacI family transcriptional regulator [Couchioplanes caeruleus]
MRAATMADIARRAGVSRIAVSYALNGRPGVSAHLRERILGIARELGYRANGPALALHGAAARAIGLVLLRSSAALTVEVFRRQLIAGIQAELSGHGFALALQMVTGLEEEIRVYRRWSAERRVDGVLICDPRPDDPRIPAVHELGLPAALIGVSPDGRLPGAWCDDVPWSHRLADHLADLGHRHIARVSGPDGMLHTSIRDEALRSAAGARGVRTTIVRGDYTGESGARLTRELLGGPERPTAVVYDNDVMAIAGLGVAGELGLAVPADLSIVACEDSPLCQVVGPPLTVVRRDIAAYGALATAQLFAALDGTAEPPVQARGGDLAIRRSTGPAPGTDRPVSPVSGPNGTGRQWRP